MSTAVLFDSAIFGGSERLDKMIESAKENVPYMLLTKEKLAHYLSFKNEMI